jgi:polysaccharide biosynthesis/export protein
MPRTLNEGDAMKTLTMSLCMLFLLSTVSTAQTQATRPSSAAPSSGATTSPTGTTGRMPAPKADVGADYRLVSGDKLRIEVYKDAALSQSLQVRPDGKITLPLLGDIAAAGKTALELRDLIANSLTTYITNPTVTVIVVETEPPVFYVMGEVADPGPYPIKGQVSILQALAMAGGFKDFANTKNISIRRGNQTLKFDYKAALKGDENPMLVQPGDTIIVP